MKRFFVTAVVLLLPLQVLAQSTSALSPEAEISFEKGVVAVGAQDWKLAIQYFLEAHERNRDQKGLRLLAPPALRLNLGLAHAKAGEELPAIAWLQAYLAAAPQAPNAAEVRKEIGRLDAATEVKIRQLLELAVLSWRQLVDAERHRYSDTWMETPDVAIAHAFHGDVETARRLFDQFEPPDARRPPLSTTLAPFREKDLQRMAAASAMHFGMNGDLERVKRAMQDVKDTSQADRTWESIATFWYQFSDSYRTFNERMPALDFSVARAAAQEIVSQQRRTEQLTQISANERYVKSFPRPFGMEPWVQAATGLSGAERMKSLDMQRTVQIVKSSESKDARLPSIRTLPAIAEDLRLVLQYLRMFQKTTPSVR